MNMKPNVAFDERSPSLKFSEAEAPHQAFQVASSAHPDRYHVSLYILVAAT